MMKYFILFFLIFYSSKVIAQQKALFEIKTSNGKKGVFNLKTQKYAIVSEYNNIKQSIEYYNSEKPQSRFYFNCYNSPNPLTIVLDSFGNVLTKYYLLNYIFYKGSAKYMIVQSTNKKYGVYSNITETFICDMIYDSIIIANYCQPYQTSHSSVGEKYYYKENYVLLIKGDKSSLFNLFNATKENNLLLVKMDWGYDCENKLHVLNFDPKEYKFDEYISINNEIKVPYLTDKKLYHKIYQNNKVGLIDREGNYVLKCKYDSINITNGFWSYKLYRDGKIGFAATTQESLNKLKILEPENNYFDSVEIFDNWLHLVKIANKWRLVRDSVFFNGIEYDKIILMGYKSPTKYYNQVYLTQKNNNWGILKIYNNSSLSNQSEFIWDEIRECEIYNCFYNSCNENYFFNAKKNGKYALINDMGLLLTSPQWDNITGKMNSEIIEKKKLFGKQTHYKNIYSFYLSKLINDKNVCIVKYLNSRGKKLVNKLSHTDNKTLKWYFYKSIYKIKFVFKKKKLSPPQKI